MRAIRLVLILFLGTILTGCRSPAPGFFPLGIYAPGSTNELQEIHSAGFNLVTGPASQAFLQAAGRHQLHVLAVIPSTPGRFFASSPVESMVRRQDSNPNLWAWYVVDEPDLNGISPMAVEQANRVVKQSGRKPTALVLYSGSDALDYAAIPDILMIDRYPVPWLPLANFSQHVRLARFAAGPQKSLITVIQAFDWNYYPELLGVRTNLSRPGGCDALVAERVGDASSPEASAPTNGAPAFSRDAGGVRTFCDRASQPCVSAPPSFRLRVPTYEEIRCMSYCALAEGANGLFYYAYDDGKWRMSDHPATWDALRQVVGEVNRRLPLFTARHPWSGIYVTYPDWASGWNEALNSAVTTVVLEAAAGNATVKKGRYVLSVNTTARDVKFQVHLPTLPGTLAVFEENRNVMVNAGVLSDGIGPYAVHVYGPF
jgi:hypothetical protein